MPFVYTVKPRSSIMPVLQTHASGVFYVSRTVRSVETHTGSSIPSNGMGLAI